jgi:hypothetical protein
MAYLDHDPHRYSLFKQAHGIPEVEWQHTFYNSCLKHDECTVWLDSLCLGEYLKPSRILSLEVLSSIPRRRASRIIAKEILATGTVDRASYVLGTWTQLLDASSDAEQENRSGDVTVRDTDTHIFGSWLAHCQMLADAQEAWFARVVSQKDHTIKAEWPVFLNSRERRRAKRMQVAVDNDRT